MKAYAFLVAATLMLPVVPAARQADPQRALLEKMTGHWVLRGTIAKAQTTHDVDAQWVLDKEYIQIHEVSREKDASGKPAYEAIIHVVWDPKAYKIKSPEKLNEQMGHPVRGEWKQT